MEVTPGYKQTEVGVIPEEWEVKSIAQIAPLQRGFDLPTTLLKDGPYPVVYSNGVMAFHDRAMARGPGVITGRSGTLGKVHYVETDYWPHNTSLWVTRFNGNDPRFVYYLYSAIGFERFASGSGVPTLNRNDAHSFYTALPPTKAEQEAIAEALSDADALIESLEQLLAKKRQLKQGAMQELLTGKKRLPGFSGDWTEAALGQMGNCHRGVSYNPAVDLSSFDTESTIRLLRANNVQEARVVVEDVQYVDSGRVSAAQRLRTNDILICMSSGSRELVGKAGRFSADSGFAYTFGAFMGCFRTDHDAADPDFVFYLFQTAKYRAHIAVLLAGSSINNLTPGSVEALMISVPSDKAEQSAIAAILSDMDTEVASLEAKLTKARNIKQGMMQELLTGRIRLV